MLTPDLTSQAERFISGLQTKEAAQIVKKIQYLCSEPFPTQSVKLEGFDFYRAKCGDYRIVYAVEGELLVVKLVESRHDDEVYKILKKLYG